MYWGSAVENQNWIVLGLIKLWKYLCNFNPGLGNNYRFPGKFAMYFIRNIIAFQSCMMHIYNLRISRWYFTILRRDSECILNPWEIDSVGQSKQNQNILSEMLNLSAVNYIIGILQVKYHQPFIHIMCLLNTSLKIITSKK
jgi:hypothetical protein